MSFGCNEDQERSLYRYEGEIGAPADPDPHRRPYVLSSHYGRTIMEKRVTTSKENRS